MSDNTTFTLKTQCYLKYCACAPKVCLSTKYIYSWTRTNHCIFLSVAAMLVCFTRIQIDVQPSLTIYCILDDLLKCQECSIVPVCCSFVNSLVNCMLDWLSCAKRNPWYICFWIIPRYIVYHSAISSHCWQELTQKWHAVKSYLCVNLYSVFSSHQCRNSRAR